MTFAKKMKALSLYLEFLVKTLVGILRLEP